MEPTPSSPLGLSLDLAEAGFLQSELAGRDLPAELLVRHEHDVDLLVPEARRAEALALCAPPQAGRAAARRSPDLLRRSRRWGASALTFLMCLRYGTRSLGHPALVLLASLALAGAAFLLADGGVPPRTADGEG